MSTKIKFYKLLTGLLFLSTASFAQVATLEMTSGASPNVGAPTGSGFGPRVTNHVVTFVQDLLNNSQFSTSPVAVKATFSLTNQQYTGLSYGSSTTNATPNGLSYGAGPSLSTGGTIQQVTPLNSYDWMDAFNGSGGPTNNMFTNVPPAGPGGIDGDGSSFGTDINSGVEVFTAAQVQFDLANPYGTANRYYYGNLVISFNAAVTNPVIHIAGLGGSYRYLPIGAPNNDPSNYRSTYFSTELEYIGAGNLQKLTGNSFLSLSGKNILNNAVTPNGGSSPNPVTDPFNNLGAATGSIQVNAVNITQLVFKVWLRGSDASQFGWSAIGAPGASQQVQGGTRNPVTGDIWYISTSLSPCVGCILLPSTGINLTAALNGNNVLLNWKTQTELNSDHFEIERSTDGINFTQIGTKQAAGNSSSLVNYSQIDYNMQASVYYYRLKLVDIDGKATYSNIAVVRNSGTVKGIRVFPNPAVDQMNLEFSNAKGNYDISLYNQNGQQVMNKNVTIVSTVQYVSLSKGSLPVGSYLVTVKNADNSEKYTEKVIFQ